MNPNQENPRRKKAPVPSAAYIDAMTPFGVIRQSPVPRRRRRPRTKASKADLSKAEQKTLEAQTEPKLVWRVHTPNLLKEVLNCPGSQILRIPLNIFASILAQVGERAIELNDPKLNWLMCRLAIYQQSDPETPEYNPQLIDYAQRLAEASFEQLTTSLKHHILAALKLSGSWDPKKSLHFVEEQMTLKEFVLANEFLMWCHKQRLTFGRPNMDQVWIAWQRDKWKTRETEPPTMKGS